MNKNIIRDMISLKMEIIDEVAQHLPPATKNKIDRLQHEFMSVMNEVTKEYLENSKKPVPYEEEAQEKIKKVAVD